MKVAGHTVTKPGEQVGPNQSLSVDTDARPFVSRGGVKLAAGLDVFDFSVRDRTALDLGASIGGFTQVLLLRGAARVYAVDVGHGQLHPSLVGDARVVSLQGRDARNLTPAEIPEPVTAVAVDLSFISLTLALPAALALTAPGAWLAALIKPQFELDPGAIGKGGVVRDGDARDRAVQKVKSWLEGQPGWRVSGVTPSPIEGSKGNLEYLIGAERVE